MKFRVPMALLALGMSSSFSFLYADPMSGMYGPYPMSREASGTSWQPDASIMDGIHRMYGADWLMVHGFANVGYTRQGGPGGDTQIMTTNMLMAMFEHPLEEGGVGLRGMMSLEPVMGKSGYSELLQTGETANGVTPLINRQHPHDLFMELAVTGKHDVTDDSSVFAYAGLPGEPALGPPAFMHRLSGEDNPEAPIGHHWMDSTHVTYGVVTLGYVWEGFKLDASAFRGREPNQYHWDIEEPKLDSYSGRISLNPDSHWSMQVSAGNLHSPEQLYPVYNTGRVTASAIYGRTWRDGWSQTTLAWGRNWQYTIDTLDAWLLESALHIGPHTFFTRMEAVQKDDLVPDEPLSTLEQNGYFPSEDFHHPFRPQNGSSSIPYSLNIFDVKRVTLGTIYDFAQGRYAKWGVGASGSINIIPGALQPFYGKLPLSYLLFLRVKLGTPGAGDFRRSPGQASPFENI